MAGLRLEERESNICSTMISLGAVDTELYNIINDPETQERTETVRVRKVIE